MISSSMFYSGFWLGVSVLRLRNYDTYDMNLFCQVRLPFAVSKCTSIMRSPLPYLLSISCA